MSASLSMQFRLPYRLEREGDVFVSICDVLDVRSQGGDPEEAGRMLVEALQLFLETCVEEGTIETVLRDSGFRPDIDAAPDTGAEEGEDYLDVPLNLLLAHDASRSSAY